MNISNNLSTMLTNAVNFHPLYTRLHEKYGFSMYVRQNFCHDDFNLELMFEAGMFYSPDNAAGRFIGGTTYQIGENTYELPNLILHLNFIGVHEGKRQKGIGQEVLSTLCQLADEEGIRYIELDVDTKFGLPKEVLQAFYKKMGFFKLSGNKMMRVNPKINTILTISAGELAIIQSVTTAHFKQLGEDDIANYPLEEIEEFLKEYQVITDAINAFTTNLTLVDCIYLLHVTAYEDIEDERFKKILEKLKEETILKGFRGFI